jgi:hypothetical protein
MNTASPGEKWSLTPRCVQRYLHSQTKLPDPLIHLTCRSRPMRAELFSMNNLKSQRLAFGEMQEYAKQLKASSSPVSTGAEATRGVMVWR